MIIIDLYLVALIPARDDFLSDVVEFPPVAPFVPMARACHRPFHVVLPLFVSVVEEVLAVQFHECEQRGQQYPAEIHE